MKTGTLLTAAAALFLAATPPATARDWFVNPETGSDENYGSDKAPLATAQVAVNRSAPGDRIVLNPPGALYRQSISLRDGTERIVIEGNGVSLSGADPLDPEAWESLGEDLHRVRLPRPAMDRHLLLVKGKAQRMGRLCANPIPFPPAGELEPGEFRWDDIDEEEGWLTYRGDVANLEWSTRPNGLATSGRVRNVQVFRLGAQHFLNDGFNIHGDARGLQFFHVGGFENFDEGFSAHDTSTCWITSGQFFGNEHAIADVNEADTYYTDCAFGRSEAVEVLFHGGRHSLTRCRIEAGPTAVPLSIQVSGPGKDGTAPPPASLVLREVTVDASGTSQRRWSVGAGCTVFLDAITHEQFEPLQLSKGNTAVISRDLYRLAPIGRHEGSPLVSWTAGAAGAPKPDNYRIVHLDRHSPSEVAATLTPGNEWFGLLSPLPAATFPPEGDAFRPENEAAHAIWRWIGLSAPDAVFVPDSPEGRSLATALQSTPPAGIGMVKVFLSTDRNGGKTETSALSRLDEETPLAKDEMIRRLARTPREVIDQLSVHYGNQFGGSYLDAVAIIARMRAGVAKDPAALARARLGDPLPKSSGNLAGTLLYAEVGEPWAVERLRAVADMAFDENGDPLAAMPGHSEMSDAVFMAGPLLVRTGELTGDPRYFDQAIRHVRFIRDLCLRDDGIYRHSPLDEAAWGRGNGFPALGIAMMLDHLPEDHPGRPFLVESVRTHLEALAPHQDSDGMWHQVIDHPDTYAEFTSTCMISYAISRGMDRGWLEEAAWAPRLRAAWEGIKARIGNDGHTLINVCTGTGKQKSLEDYYLRKAILGPDARGGAMALLLAGELERAEISR